MPGAKHRPRHMRCKRRAGKGRGGWAISTMPRADTLPRSNAPCRQDTTTAAAAGSGTGESGRTRAMPERDDHPYLAGNQANRDALHPTIARSVRDVSCLLVAASRAAKSSVAIEPSTRPVPKKKFKPSRPLGCSWQSSTYRERHNAGFDPSGTARRSIGNAETTFQERRIDPSGTQSRSIGNRGICTNREVTAIRPRRSHP